MNTQDYIRKAVELADGFSEYRLFHSDGSFMGIKYGTLEFALGNEAYKQFILDALAAQLTRQVTDIPDTWIVIDGGIGEVRIERLGVLGKPNETLTCCDYDDGYSLIGAECQIRAIIDSKVLEKP